MSVIEFDIQSFYGRIFARIGILSFMGNFLSSIGDRVWLFGFLAFAVLCVRYFVISGVGYLVFWVFFPKRLHLRRVQKDSRRPTLVGAEIFWSLCSFVSMAVLAAFIYALFIRGFTKVSTNWDEHSIAYHGLTFFLLFFIHDTYFYWMHRTLHNKTLFKIVHSIHHRSLNPTPWAAFAFHPFEAMCEMLFLIPVLIFIPIHLNVLIVFLILSHVFNMLGHSGYEVFPKGAWNAWWGFWVTTTTHHNLHHQHFNGNYALYLKFWDSWCGTLLPMTEIEFKKLTEPKN